MNVAIIGCGLVGQKRARALGGHRLVVCADTHLDRAAALAAQHLGCEATSETLHAVERADVAAVVVATTHDALAATAISAAKAGKHVLMEKPGARSACELRPVLDAVKQAGVVAKVGFNHRFHPALQRARAIVADNGVGELLYLRGRYGHGGRQGYEHEWRADPQLSGGGELLDQGTHLIDLARWFLGDFEHVDGYLGTYFWPMAVEDNAFVMLGTHHGQVAWLHASWTEWKNLFSFEIFGRTGKLQIDGLGGSYGTERLTHYRMPPELGPPDVTTWEFVGEDRSWDAEFEHFAACIASGAEPSGSLDDALAALVLIGRLYEEQKRDHRS